MRSSNDQTKSWEEIQQWQALQSWYNTNPILNSINILPWHELTLLMYWISDRLGSRVMSCWTTLGEGKSDRPNKVFYNIKNCLTISTIWCLTPIITEDLRQTDFVVLLSSTESLVWRGSLCTEKQTTLSLPGCSPSTGEKAVVAWERGAMLISHPKT